MRFVLVALVLLFAAGRGWAFETGNDFLRECEPATQKVFTQLTDDERYLAVNCGGYLRGFICGIRVAERGTASRVICSPAGVEIRHVLKITVKWMNNHKEQLNKSAVELIFSSLLDEFPCSEKKPPLEEDSEKNQPLRL